ncbi:MAG: glycosyltransferase, partial [Candidatus Omnitrophica bacterium]|nr:glycosyltransferase [Candidatus Omnitrophota bacterium]
MIRILVITKRQYTHKDLLDDQFGRLRELPLQLALRKCGVFGLCLSYRKKKEGRMSDGPVEWESINAGLLKIPGLIRFFRRASQLAAKADGIWACSDSIYGIIVCLLASKYRIPLAFDLYDNFEYFLAARLPVIKQLYRRAIRKSQAVTCVSRPLVRLVTSYGKKEAVFVIENGVRKDLFRPMDKKTCRESLGLPQHVRLVGTAGALYD